MVNQKKSRKNLSKSKSNNSRWNWLDNAGVHENQGYTFPQVKPSLLTHETPQSLDGKIPMVPGATDFVVLCTTKIGTKRFVVPPDAEFDLSDPVSDPYGPLSTYNFLHDPHLNDYLMNPTVKKTLIEKGLITNDGYVKCTIKGKFNLVYAL